MDNFVPITPQPQRNKRPFPIKGVALKAVALKALFTVILILGVTEASLRFGLGLGNPILISSDPVCGYIVKPRQNVSRFHVRTEINSYGMRSAEVPEHKSPQVLRIMFVGDSLTYGTTRVNQDDTFCLRLERELPTLLHRPVEVLNASANGWAIANEVAYVRSRGIFHSDIVLLVLNSGDLAQPFSQLRDVSDSLPQTRPASALSELYQHFLQPLAFGLTQREDAGTSTAPDNGNTLQQNLALIQSLNDLVTQQHSRFVILYIPFRRDVPSGADHWAPSSLTDVSRLNHLRLVDLTSAESSSSPDDITLDNGVHFNAKGNKLLADAMEQRWQEISML